MTDYIEREAAIEFLSQPITMSMCLSTEECHHKRAQQSIDRYLIENIPAADVPPVKRGEWVDGKGNPVPWDELNKNCPSDSAFCSVCGEWLTASDEYPAIGNFCPNCGADMRPEPPKEET